MDKICVFAGTTEGRELVAFLSEQKVSVTACVATEYGETLLAPAENLTVSARRMTEEEMTALFAESRFSLVVDATHPYASVVTRNIRQACGATGTEYLRLLRSGSAAPEDAVFAADIDEAVRYLNTTQGNILLTTGSKELSRYTSIEGFSRRVFARVLPMEDSLRLCREAGVQPSHIFAMQGPFTRQMNVAMLRSIDAKYLVTKESGTNGGFGEKIAAAGEAGARLLVIGRPPQGVGMDFSQTVDCLCRRFGLIWKPAVTVVGIGPGSRESMTVAAQTAIEQADCIIGAKRMIQAAAGAGQAVQEAIAPAAIADFIHSHREYRRYVVVMSGDVGFYSGTKKLLPLLADCQVKLLPGINSMAYLCAKLETSYEDVVPVSLHGRTHNICRDVRRHGRVFVLTGGENGMGQLCRKLTEAGLGDVWVSAGECLGYPDENITVGMARDLAERSFQSLCAALIENAGADDTVTHGLPDEAFLRTETVPMTKSEVRSVCLSKLRLTASAVAWDIGAGTGSVAIEMALQAVKGSVYAIERKEAAVALLRENCAKFETDNLTVVPGTAPDACNDLPAPTHVFIGGTCGNLKQILTLVLRKNPNVRIVATAIALESAAELTACMKEFPFAHTEVVCLNVAKDRKAGSYHLMMGQNPIYICTMQGGSV